MHPGSTLMASWRKAVRRQLPRHLPLLLLALALSSLFVWHDIGHGGYFYHTHEAHNWRSAKSLALAGNLSLDQRLRLFTSISRDLDGAPVRSMYSRFPLPGYALIKLAMAPFDGATAKIFAARLLMLALLGAAMALAYAALRRITDDRWIALAATLLAFSSRPALFYADAVLTDGMMGLFAVMLVFHGMVLYAQDGRFGQLLAKTCLALLLDWHVYALLAAFIGIGLATYLLFRRKHQATPRRCDLGRPRANTNAHVATFQPSRLLALGLVAFLFGTAVLGFNLANEYATHESAGVGSESSWRQLPTVRSITKRIGWTGPGMEQRIKGGWPRFAQQQIEGVGRSFVPRIFAREDMSGAAWRGKGAAPPNGLGTVLAVFGALAVVGCLLGLFFARLAPSAKTLLLTLALFGFCWALPMRHSVAGHGFSLLFYIGVPLTVLAVGLLHGAKRAPRLSRMAAFVAVPIFIASVAETRHTVADEHVARQKEALAELDRLLAGESGKSACFAEDLWHIGSTEGETRTRMRLRFGMRTLPRLALPRCAVRDDGAVRMRSGAAYDVVVTSPVLDEGHEDPALLTPRNRFAFLYDGAVAAAPGFYSRAYRRLYAKVSTGVPVARGRFDVYLDADKLVFIREPCRIDDLAATFFVHVVPSSLDDLGRNGHASGFDNLDFSRTAIPRGEYFVDPTAPRPFIDGRCMVTKHLPNYRIANVATGQYTSEGVEIWRVSFEVDSTPSS